MAVKRHLISGFEGLLRRAMYVFDDAIVFVDPPRSAKFADALRLILGKTDAVRFEEAGFSDARITSTMLTEQLERTMRVPHRDISRVQFDFHPDGFQPYVTVKFACTGAASPAKFYMRHRMAKVGEAHEILCAVLGPRVGTLDPY